jgi:hypothetical protein
VYHRAVAERRLPYLVTDDEGVARRGEIVIVSDAGDSFRPGDDADFSIVLARNPPGPEPPHPEAANVVICSPASRVRIPAAVGDERASYGRGLGEAPALRLPPTAMTAYAQGALLSQAVLWTPAEAIFGGAKSPRFDLLAREILASGQSGPLAWADAAAVLAWPAPAPRLTQAERVRAQLRSFLRRLPSDVRALEVFERLRAAAEGGRAVAPSPDLAEDIAHLRCLMERPNEATALGSMLAYLGRAVIGPRLRTLVVDHAATREQLSFVTLLEEPHRFDSMRAAFEAFSSSYAAAYSEHHQRYWQAVARIRADLADAAPAAGALARLNTLRALGPPAGEDALHSYERLRQERTSCDMQALETSLAEQPICPECGITLADEAPRPEAERAARELNGALAAQQARLASEAVRRILARGGERLDRFMQVVQAADTGALTRILDDELLAFLRELLAEPVSPTAEALSLLEELARAYPEVTDAQVEEVIETLRHLLRQRLAALDADREAAPVVRLANTDRP